MADPFIGQISIFGFSYAPVDWVFCAGQTQQAQQNQALFALLGTTFGGSGTNFQLPNLVGRVPVGMSDMGTPSFSGNSFPLSRGKTGGQQTAGLAVNNLPAHAHAATFVAGQGGSPVEVQVQASVDAGDSPTPTPGCYLAQGVDNVMGASPSIYRSDKGSSTVNLGGVTVTGSTGGGSVVIGSTGSNQPFPVQNPYLALNFCIALNGIFPSRD